MVLYLASWQCFFIFFRTFDHVYITDKKCPTAAPSFFSWRAQEQIFWLKVWIKYVSGATCHKTDGTVSDPSENKPSLHKLSTNTVLEPILVIFIDISPGDVGAHSQKKKKYPPKRHTEGELLS